MILCFAFGLVLVSVVRLSQPDIFPSRWITQSSPQMAEDLNEVLGSSDQSAQVAIDYHLPSPGILPDHPLYWLKMIRDRGQLWTSANLQDRLVLVQEYANKRLAAGYALIRSGEQALGVSTITKAEKYLLQAAQLLEQMQLTQLEKENLNTIFLYHQQTLLALMEMVEDEHKGALRESLELNKQSYEEYLKPSFPSK